MLFCICAIRMRTFTCLSLLFVASLSNALSSPHERAAKYAKRSPSKPVLARNAPRAAASSTFLTKSTASKFVPIPQLSSVLTIARICCERQCTSRGRFQSGRVLCRDIVNILEPERSQRFVVLVLPFNESRGVKRNNDMAQWRTWLQFSRWSISGER